MHYLVYDYKEEIIVVVDYDEIFYRRNKMCAWCDYYAKNQDIIRHTTRSSTV